MTSSRFSFLRRVRIHGGECGAVARALHHEVKGLSLYQADPKKAFGSTIERKQMSTKKTLKRIALVAVSALGFGLMTTVVPANAAASATLSARETSFTVVQAGGTRYAVVQLQTTDVLGNKAKLEASEVITATTISTPNQPDSTTQAGALTFTGMMQTDIDTAALVVNAGDSIGSVSSGNSVLDANSTTYDDSLYNSASTKALCTTEKAKTLGTTASSTVKTVASEAAACDGYGAYFVRIELPSNALGAGFYTVRFTLNNGSANVSSVNVTVKAVASADALTDSVISVAKTAATVMANEPLGGDNETSTMTVTVTDVNGGLIVAGDAGIVPFAPRMRLVGSDATATAVATAATFNTTSGFTAVDNGAATTSVDGDAQLADGVWDLVIAGGVTPFANYGGTSTLIADFVGSGKSASTTMTFVAAASGTATAGVSATGKYSASSTAVAHDIPLSTKSVTFFVQDAGAVTGKAYFYSVDYTGCVVADMSLTENTSTRVLTDATGLASVTLTHANPIDNCSAALTWIGATITRPTHTVTWNAPVATTAVSDPGGSFQALLKSTNKISWTILDQYGAPVTGKTVTFTMTGKNAPTTGVPSKVTDSSGVVSYEWTDALATADTTDTIRIATVGGDTPTTTGSVTITYKSALSVVASLRAQYAADATTIGTAPITIPTTNIGGLAGRAISAADQIDLGSAITGAAANHFLAFKFTALTAADVAVTGIPTTVTVDNGFILSSAGRLVTSRILYANDTFWAIGLKTGVMTITAKNGSLTSTAKINWVNAHTDARVLKATESNGTITAAVTDFYGNPVSGVTVNATSVGGRFGNGATGTTFVTGDDGTVAFDMKGSATVTVSLGSTYNKADFLAGYGDASGTTVTTGAPAGVRSVTVKTSGVADVATDAATAASDAALEAIDAANAATDAANLAAEAADAATVAAEEARDAADAATAAVEALASEVATLIAGLKAQITTLANTVAKIAKRVRA